MLDREVRMSFSSDQPLMANQLPISLELPTEDAKMLSDALSLLLKRFVDSINTKEGALYMLQELSTFQLWFTPTDAASIPTYPGNIASFRNGYRSVFDMTATAAGGPIPAGATRSVAHNLDVSVITATTRIYGGFKQDQAAPGPYFGPIPYASTVAINQNIEVYMDATNVNVIVGAGQFQLDQCYIVWEYIKG